MANAGKTLGWFAFVKGLGKKLWQHGSDQMYQEQLKKFKNIENLAGKAWEHAVAIDVLATTEIKDCSIECFHYQQMMELFFKHILETRSQFGSYSRSHKLQKLLEEVIANTKFRTDKTKYFMALQVITVCAEEYRYNFLIDCEGYKQSVTICDQLLEELVKFESGEELEDTKPV